MCRFRPFVTLALLLAALAAFAAPIEDAALEALLAKAPTPQQYPGVPAVCLLREMEVTLAPNGNLTVRERKLTTLLTKDALKQAQQVAVPYDKSLELVEIRTARSLVNGQAYAADPRQMAESALYPGITSYDTLMLRRLPIPGAVVGATTEVETIYRRPLPRMAGAFNTRAPFQLSYPVKEARYIFRMPANLPLHIRFTNGVAPKVEERVEGDLRVYTWTLRDVPALRVTETQTPPVNDLIFSGRATTLTSWAPVVQWYQGITKDKAEITDAVRKLAETKTANCKTVDEKIAALHKVVRELPFIAVEFGAMADEPHTPQQVLEHQFGDCKDKATLLKALLAAVGIESWYVLARTTDRGALDPALYGAEEFNHVILAAATPAGDRYLDATLADAPATRLSSSLEGAQALVVRGAGEIVTLPTSRAEDNRTDVTVAITVKADRSATGRLTLSYTGQAAILQRGVLARVPADRMKEALEPVLAMRLGGHASITSVTVNGLREPEAPLTILAEFAAPTFLQPAGEQFSGTLPLFMYQPNRYRTVEERTFPFVQQLESALHMTATVTLPEGYTVAALPEATAYEGPLGVYRDSTAVKDRTLTFTCDQATKRGTFPAATLPEFKKLGAILALEGRNQLQFFVKK